MTININRNLVEFPITLQKVTNNEPSEIDYAKIQAMIDSCKNTIVDKIEDVNDIVESGNRDVSTLLITLGDEVEENQSIIESRSGNTRLIL
jgi:hypothetical protein